MRFFSILITFLFISGSIVHSQDQEWDKKILNWYNGTGTGMHTDKAYKKFLSKKTPKPVIVAVVDSGVDIEHEDLKGHIWTNEDEIPDNGIDDDNNGYIDDVHGWNFLGNADGEILNDVQLEMTRIYAKYDSLFKDRTYGELNDDEKPFYDLYREVKEKVEEKIEKCEKNIEDFEKDMDRFREADEKLKEQGGGEVDLSQFKELREDPDFEKYLDDYITMWLFGFFTFEDYVDAYEYWVNELAFNYNPNINPRTLIGDDPSNFEEIGYGNNNVRGEGAEHGTHVSGIIAGIRGNELGGDGVSDAAIIMPIRAVPDGDERDKDVALAIRYAVDNGAQIINMSFGKPYSPYKEEVMDAFKYAEEKGVLLVHGAGNEAENNDDTENYPTSKYKGMDKRFGNWIEVGASTRFKKYKLKKGFITNWGLVTDFSNYGEEMVDVFAPGEDIISTVPDNEYDNYDGTSMASPMVAGVAALLKSYYPELSMFQIKEIMMSSVQDLSEEKVIRPGDKPKVVYLKTMCVSGGVINVYNACQMAEEMTQ